MVSKPPEVKIQTEDKQCGHTLERIEPATPSSGLEDDSKDRIESNAENLDAPESGGYDDFEDDWDLHSTGAGDLQSFATKNDIERLETQQEVILANQNLKIWETSLGNSNPKNTKNTTLTPEELKKQAENKACLKEVCEMIGNSYSKAELAESSYEGGKRKYKGREFNKKGLSPARMKKIMKSVSQKHPEAYARLKDGPDLREAINMKCRKTSCKAQSSAQSSSGNANQS